jgi:hypothetical protein
VDVSSSPFTAPVAEMDVVAMRFSPEIIVLEAA